MGDTRGVERWLTADLGPDARKAPRAIQLKLDKLARDPFAFFRGTLPEYVRRVRATCRGGVYRPEGVITGDLHLENLGTFLAADGAVAFDLNDFDDAGRAPLAAELRRLGASARLAARPRWAEATAEAVLEGFELGLSDDALAEPAAVADLRSQCAALDPAAFIARSTVGGTRLAAGEATLVALLKTAARSLHGREAHLAAGFFDVLDAAPRLAGNGSLGRRRYLALLAGSDPSRGLHALVDFKEPRPSPWGASSSLLGASARAEQVERIARTFRAQSERVLGTARLHGRLFQVREHSAFGLKVAAIGLEARSLVEYARYCGAMIARAWTRAGQPALEVGRALRGAGGAVLREHIRIDAERMESDYESFVAKRERIARRLGLLPSGDAQRVA